MRPYSPLRQIWAGLVRYRYPPCCVARWVFEYHCRKVDGELRKQAVARGGIWLDRRPADVFVPCGVFHTHRHPCWKAHGA